MRKLSEEYLPSGRGEKNKRMKTIRNNEHSKITTITFTAQQRNGIHSKQVLQ